MAGVAGKSGGARSGSGRKPAPKLPFRPTPDVPVKVEVPLEDAAPHGKTDALEYLLRVVADAGEETATRVRAAIAAVQYQRVKRADGGKREDQAEVAKKVAAGKFASSAPPRLVASR